MLNILCALQWEAQPFISNLKLKRDLTDRAFQVFHGNGISLIISGIGKIRAAMATTYLLSHSRSCLQHSQQHAILVNVGLCGANKSHNLGQPYYCTKVHDLSAQRTYYPDVLFKHGLDEATLLTSDRPITEPSKMLDLDLVDMEASGVLEAASAFIGPERVVVIKVASDHLEANCLNRESATSLIENNFSSINQALKRAISHFAQKPQILNNHQIGLLNELAQQLRCTASQKSQLFELALRNAAKRESSSLGNLERFLSIAVQNRSQQKRYFNELLHEIRSA